MIFSYECPSCHREDTSTKLIGARICPSCRTDIYLEWERQKRINSALRFTNLAIARIEGCIDPDIIEMARRII